MDYVSIEDGYGYFDARAKLDNVVVCIRAKIGMRSQLKDCEIGGGCVVAADCNFKN